MIEFDTHDVLCFVSNIVLYSVSFLIGFDTHDVLSFVFEYYFDTQYVLCIVSRYRLILDMFYVTFQGYRLGVFMVTVYKGSG